MKKRLSTIMAIVVTLSILFIAGPVMAAEDSTTQTMNLNVNEIAVLDVTDDPGSLTIVAPATGGMTPADVTDNTTYAQYTSVVNSDTTRRLTAGIDVDAPAGTILTLVSSGVSGTSGTPQGKATLLTASAVDIVLSIGSCATGTGGTDGA